MNNSINQTEQKSNHSQMIQKTGLVLEGGGMRGIYTTGVLDAFLEEQLHFDGVIGVSAGAIHGSSFVSGQKGRNIRYYKKYCMDKRFISIRNFILTGDFVGEKFCYHDIPEKLDLYDYNAFHNSNTEFYAVCSNLDSGKAEYMKITDMKKDIDYMRASASLPYISKIVTIDGKKLLDGGCTDSIPIKAFQKMGFSRNVIVLTQHDGYVKKPENLKLSKLFYRKYPNFIKALQNRHNVYNKTLEEIHKMEKDGSVFVIRPSVELTIGRMEKNPEALQKVYKIGYRDAKKQIPKLLAWLEQ